MREQGSRTVHQHHPTASGRVEMGRWGRMLLMAEAVRRLVERHVETAGLRTIQRCGAYDDPGRKSGRRATDVRDRSGRTAARIPGVPSRRVMTVGGEVVRMRSGLLRLIGRWPTRTLAVHGRGLLLDDSARHPGIQEPLVAPVARKAFCRRRCRHLTKTGMIRRRTV